MAGRQEVFGKHHEAKSPPGRNARGDVEKPRGEGAHRGRNEGGKRHEEMGLRPEKAMAAFISPITRELRTCGGSVK